MNSSSMVYYKTVEDYKWHRDDDDYDDDYYSVFVSPYGGSGKSRI